MAICGDKYENPLNGNMFVCTEPPNHTDENGTMHEADTMKGPVNW